MSLSDDRDAFNNRGAAETLAAGVGPFKRSAHSSSTRFACFEDRRRFVIVAGAQEGKEIDLALVYGLTDCGSDRRLVLVLPEQHAFSTFQRAPWFREAVRPEIWLHNGASARRVELPSRQDTIEQLRRRLGNESPEAELRKAATAIHLGMRSDGVVELVEWATSNSQLDPAHRQSERAWHCMGRKVLSIKSGGGDLVVQAGIDYADAPPKSVRVTANEPLNRTSLEEIQKQVKAGIDDRLETQKPDEHWLQAVIRHDPSLIGIEQPALRELPAWRPKSGPAHGIDSPNEARWGRGFIDLVGLDGAGDVRIAESKLSSNADERFILQGLDYYVWSRAYEVGVRERLSAPTRSVLKINFILATDQKDRLKLSRFSAALADGLDPDVPWQIWTVHDWFHPDDPLHKAHSESRPPRTIV